MSRPLRRPHDFERFAGETVQIKLDRAEGRKRWTGVLKGFEDGAVTIDTDEGEQRFSLDEIAKCTIKPDFDTAGKKRGGKN
jgi:ribosome maturation factor RimP